MLLYNKYRPRLLTDLVGQNINSKILKNIVDSGQIRPSYMFIGPKGTGKTTSARILAKMINCEKGISSTPCLECENCLSIENGSSVEVREIDAASHNGVDDIRAINEEVNFSSLGSRFKVWILDEAHMLTRQAWNAFLKNLEEPPPNTIFIICTTEANQIPETVRCRCLRFNFSKISETDTFNFLKMVCDKEEVQYEDNALKIISKNSKGGLRDALTDLEKIIIASDNFTVTEALASQISMTLGYKVVFYLAKSILDQSMKNVLLITQGMDKTNIQVGPVLDELITLLHSVYSYQILKNDNVLLYVPAEQRESVVNLCNEFDNNKLAKTITTLSECYRMLAYNPNPRYYFDVAMHKAMCEYSMG